MSIKKLSPDVIDQIAAGEVVERPANLLKELIENSIDAGATRIDIQFEHGGRWVQIKDNGGGIAGDELELALSRHATSKISKADDLWSLHSFGFRGEALSAISAVSQCTLISRKKGSKNSYTLTSKFGKLSDVTETSTDEGTTITIEKLFENVPARLKFLKSESAEATQIKNVIKAMAMTHPSVEFYVKHKSQMIMTYGPNQSHKERVESVLEVKNLYPAEAEVGGYKCKAFVSSPKDTVRSRRSLWTFVQSRWVTDRSLQTALLEAYRNLLMHGEYPVAALWVECPADAVDVNIHPTKTQVKFQEAGQAFRVVLKAVRNTLEKAPWLDEILPTKQYEKTEEFNLKVSHSPTENLKFETEDFDKVQYNQKISNLIDNFSKKAGDKQEPYQNNLSPSNNGPNLASMDSYEQGVSSVQEMKHQAEVNNYQQAGVEVSNTLKNKPAQRGFWSNLQVLGQADLTYILAQSDKALFLVDMHAAHERVAFESLMQAWKDGSIDVQKYLLPLTLDFEAEAIEALKTYIPEFEKMGLYLESPSEMELNVVAAPTLLKEPALVKALKQMSEEIQDLGGSFAFEKKVADLCATMACHSVVRAGQALSHEQMQSLLVQMDEFPLSSFCPHGRPVYIEYPFSKIEKDFGRIV
ncbi:MAG: DNA mismatch repair endonuclease MutL [Bdellovibrionales bacterium]|nr:DNA mismatch repair endonuclease MutL [Bdellovibrionales bacterium]